MPIYDQEDDPRQRIRNRVMQQGAGAVPNDSPSAPAPSPDFTPANGNTGVAGGYQPQVQPNRASQPPINAGAIPTNPSGSQVGHDIPWTPGSDRPSYDPPGYHWDPNLASFQANGAGDTTRPGPAMPEGIDPRLAALYAKYGKTPGARGSGFVDWQYWQDKIHSGDGYDYLGRLENDLAGRGTDADAGQPQGGGGGAAPAGVSPFIAGIRQQLLARMARDQQPVNDTDSYIAQPFNAAKLSSDRELEQSNKENAQAAYAQAATGGGVGVDQAALGQQATQGRERAASSLGTLKGQLVSREYQARRDDLNSAFQQALASGDAEMARNIQMAIAQMDDAFRGKSLGFDMAKFAQGQNNAAFGAGA